MEKASSNRWTKPGFVIATTLLGIVAMLGVVAVVRSAGDRGESAAGATAARSPTAAPDRTGTDPTPSPEQPAVSGDSICGLADAAADPAEFEAPDADWKYDGAVAYPSRRDYGPGRTSPAGFRYCFQHSARGALFSAAGSMAFNNTGAEASGAWSRYMQAEGPYRDSQLDDEYVPADPSVRSRTIGYRLLSYDHDRAKVDLAVRVSSPQQSVTTSVLLDLVWQRGDWRFSSDVAESVQVARLVDLSGYTAWSDA